MDFEGVLFCADPGSVGTVIVCIIFIFYFKFPCVFNFITKKPLWANIAVSAGLLLLLLLLFLGSLQLITRHGKTMKIPQVVGQSLAEARKTLESQGFGVLIQDSIYLDTVAPLQVI